MSYRQERPLTVGERLSEAELRALARRTGLSVDQLRGEVAT